MKKRREIGSQRERSDATRAELVTAARAAFATLGYAATSLDDVVDAAGVTKGALYYHFDSKQDLFQAVYASVQDDLARAMTDAAAEHADPWEGYGAGLRAFLEASLDPGVQRITLLDAPSVLGWETMREIRADYGLKVVKDSLASAIAAGLIADRPVGPLAHLLLGAAYEGAMTIARSEDQQATTEQVLQEFRGFIDAFAIRGPKGFPNAA